MNSKENAQSLLLNYNCKYNHFIAAYYNAAYIIHLFRDFEVYNNLSYPYILKGNLKRKGTKFMLRRPDLGVLMFTKQKNLLLLIIIQDLNIIYIKQFLKPSILFTLSKFDISMKINVI